jgi:hypothetical protein
MLQNIQLNNKIKNEGRRLSLENKTGMAIKGKKHEAGGGRLTCFSRTQVYEKEGTIAQIYYL